MKKLFHYFLVIALIIGMIALSIRLISQIRWDKVPVIGPMLVLGPTKYFGISAYSEPITWNQLQERPEDYDPYNPWFDFINGYTIKLLEEYMKNNNLAIVPKEYLLETSNTFEELLEVLEFVPTGNTGDGSVIDE